MIKKIKEIYEQEGDNHIYDLPTGIYGSSNIEDIYSFCKRIALASKKSFIDLGSGDGRVVIIASLFTSAIGIEGDEKLVKKSKELKEKINKETTLNLGTTSTFLCEDYLKHDLSKYECIFIFPDHPFNSGLNQKLKKELTGTLYVYGGAFQPEGLVKGRKIHVGKNIIDTYTSK